MNRPLYIRVRGRVSGPYSEDKLRLLVRRGQLSQIHELSEDAITWVRASMYAELFSKAASSSGTAPTGRGTEAYESEAVDSPSSYQQAPSALYSDNRTRRVQTPWYQRASMLIGIAAISAPLLVLGTHFATVSLFGRKTEKTTLAAAKVDTKESSGNKRAASVDDGALASNRSRPNGETQKTASVEAVAAPSDSGAARPLPVNAPRADAETSHPPKEPLPAKSTQPTGSSESNASPGKDASAVAEKDVVDAGKSTEQVPKDNPTQTTGKGEEEKAAPTTLTSIKNGEAIANAVGKVVVGWEVTDYQGKLYQVPVSVGTTFAINHEGAMLTNKHVIEWYVNQSRAEQFKADVLRTDRYKLQEKLWVFINQQKYGASVTYASPDHDFAFIKVERECSTPFAIKVSIAKMLDESVRAVGFPEFVREGFTDEEKIRAFSKRNLLHENVAGCFGKRDLQYLLTSGTVSQVAKDEAIGAIWLHHSATIAPGNSGGPLVLPDATVVGVNTQGGGNFFRALTLGQFRKIIDKHVPGVTWIP